MQRAGLPVAGDLDDLIASVDVMVDCTPKGIGAANAEVYRRKDKPFIVQGGEKHEVAGHSFVAESSYAGALGRPATRVVSCNTTSIVRTLTALKQAGLLRRARGTLLRRATDPWESDRGGIMNTLAPEPQIPSHQGPDAQSVDPDLDVVTMAVKVPETIAHLHYWSVQMTRAADKAEVVAAFLASSRIAAIRMDDGLTALNSVKELMADLGRPHDNLYEVALWTDMLRVQGDELFYAYMVDNQAIVIPETIDAIRALSAGSPRRPCRSPGPTPASASALSTGWVRRTRSGTHKLRAGAAARAMRIEERISGSPDGEGRTSNDPRARGHYARHGKVRPDVFPRLGQGPIQHSHEFGGLGPPLRLVPIHQRAGHTVIQVVLEDFGFHPPKRRAYGLQLGEDVDAVAVLVDHAGDAPHLPFDAAEAVEQLRLVVMVQERLRWRRKNGQSAKVGSTSMKDGLYDWQTEAVFG